MRELPVSEYAAIIGKSKQAVYQQINNPRSKIKPYVVKRGNQTFIQDAALQDLYGIEQDSSQVDSSSVKESSQVSSPESSQNEQLASDYIEFLKEQIAQKDAIIAQKEAIITEQASQIQEQHTELQALSQQLIDISKNALSLAAGQQTLTAPDKGVKPESQAILEYSQDESSLEVKPAEKKHSRLYHFFFG